MKRRYILFFIIIILILLYILEFKAKSFFHSVILKPIINSRNVKNISYIKKITLENDFKNSYFNPTLFFHDENIYIIKRISKLDKFLSRTIFKNNFIKKNYQTIAKIDQRDLNFKLVKSKKLKFLVEIENFNNKIFKSYHAHQIIEDIKILKLVDTKLMISYSKVDLITKIGIGYIDLNMIDQKITHLNTITKSNGKEITGTEKNWQIIDNPSKEVLKILYKYNYDEDKHLLMLTYATPLWIVSIIDIEGGNKLDIPEFKYNLGKKLIDEEWPNISKSGKAKIEENLRCTTSLEIINEQYYITVLHTYNPYISVFCLVDIKTLEPMYIYGPVKFKNYNCIEYPSTIKVIGDIIYLGLGINDSKSEIYLINKQEFINNIIIKK